MSSIADQAAAGREALRTGDIHLWCARPDAIGEPGLLAAYRRLLNRAELDKGRRFRFERDRHRFLVTRALVRVVLSRYAPVAPAQWQFAADSFGRPSVAGPLPRAGLTFNLSHTDGMILLAVGGDGRLGVDVERLGRRSRGLAIARRLFAPSEAADVESAAAELREQRFLEYWTLKEAYVKARGQGLSIALARFAFALERGRVRLTVEPGEEEDPGRWRFAQFRLPPDHVAALCTDLPCPGAPTFTWREIVPLGEEREMEPELLWASPATD